jgi:hypothetical protein
MVFSGGAALAAMVCIYTTRFVRYVFLPQAFAKFDEYFSAEFPFV